jgi:hypothetical protein
VVIGAPKRNSDSDSQWLRTPILVEICRSWDAGVAPKTERAIARRYEEEGLDWALYEKPRPGRARVLNGGQKLRSWPWFAARSRKAGRGEAYG